VVAAVDVAVVVAAALVDLVVQAAPLARPQQHPAVNRQAVHRLRSRPRSPRHTRPV